MDNWLEREAEKLHTEQQAEETLAKAKLLEEIVAIAEKLKVPLSNWYIPSE